MKWKVDLYVGGKVFPEYCYAVNRQDAIETAKSRNPHARVIATNVICLLYTSPSPRDVEESRMPSSA